MRTTTTYIAVCGPDPAPEGAARDAEEVGRLIARAGAVLVCGGLGGTMEAAARGAASEGGVVLGILPGNDRSRANDHLTVSVPTGMGEMRNTLVVRAADAVIAIEVEFGTLSEIAFALKTRVPVVGLRTWQLAKHETPVTAFRTVESPEMAVREALRLAANDGRPTGR
jgi:uncharacterized protein (TIGR00725 family)